MADTPSQKNFETEAIRNQTERTQHHEHATPLFMTSSFVFDSAEHARALFAREQEGNVYSRYSNPTVDEFIAKMCNLEGTAAGVATGSGMAAVFSSLAAFLNQGDHVLVSRSVFGSTHQVLTSILPRWGIEHTYVDTTKPENWEAEIRDNTQMLFLETPSNPGLDLIDLEWAGKLAKKHDLLLNVDNCFATPYLQQPALYGADIVTHSATKFIDGQGRAIGGIILGSQALMHEVEAFTRHTGPALSPFNAWLFSKSLETLPVRMERHCASAHQIAEFLEGHEDVESVKYPFLESHPQQNLAKKQMRLGGGIVCFNIEGGYERATSFLDQLQMLSLSANLGDTRTIATHPASTTHSKLTEEERQAVSIGPGTIRISTGLEHSEDIISDLAQALEQS